MKPEVTSTCQACGARIPAGLDFCPVCAFRGALYEARETSELNVDPTHSSPASRLDHYQILTEEDGTPLELGRGAMGMTYKAIDVNLRCTVALKVINARLIGDESARRRFVREARAAASVRHPNVASVFHLGQTGDGYFYAMEFVEGETLENLVKRRGRLGPKVALEITSQVAAGLSAIHEQNLVHRDVKPANIMVSLKDDGRLIAKIIDLGLAKPIADASTEAAISIPGAFAGTPAFASPEQFAGVGVDIRSDLYSLGVVLWEMVTGRPPFRGTPPELIYQHQHGALPLKQLKGVPPQVKAVLQTLLDKDPKRRFQNPAELLQTLLRVRSELEKAADQEHKVQKPVAQNSTVVTEQPRLEPVYGEGLIEVSGKGFGFLRDAKRHYVQSPQDISVTPEVVRKHALRDGLWIKGEIRRSGRGSQLFKLTEINGEHPDRYKNLPVFEELTSLNPKSRIRLETVSDRYTTRVMDLMMPLGKGQRGLIVAPPHTGKTTLLQHIASGVIQNHPEVNLIVLLIDERREEVTEMRRTIPQADIMASSNDSDFSGHTRIAQLAIERAKRLVEAGKDVLVLMDSLTRLGRAFNNAMSDSGRTMSDGMDARAMEILRTLFAAARNTEEAGSLTIIATVLIETGSKMDELIFQEFKGTGNVEIVLDRLISDQGVHPAIDVFKSGTRREELLVPANDLEKINTIRRGLAGIRPVEAIERLLSSLRKFPTNAQMLRGTRSGRTKTQERSVVVLPFESLSTSKKDTYFADGVQDEILSNLAKVSQLKVISRTSVMKYRSRSDRDLRSIAAALGVGHVVEGTVRRQGSRVRVTSKLINARTDEIVWSDCYDRDLTDIFVVQSEIAQTVASKMSARLSPGERKDIEGTPTSDLEAYDLYLQAKELISNSEFSFEYERSSFLKAIDLLESAIRKDSKFGLAYCLIAKAQDNLYISEFDRAKRRALGDAAVNEALRLHPDLPEAHLAMAFHRYTCYHDYERSRVQIALAQRALPNSPEALLLAARLDQRQGRWDKSTTGLERAATLDPRNPVILNDLVSNYRFRRRYRDAKRILNQLIELEPDKPFLKIRKAYVAFCEKADLSALRAATDTLPSSVKNELYMTSWRFGNAVRARDWIAARQTLSKNSSDRLVFSFSDAVVPSECGEIWLAAVQGKLHTIKPAFVAARDELKQQVEAHPDNASLLSALAIIDMTFGRKQEAIRNAQRAVEICPISEDAVQGQRLLDNLAIVWAWTDQPDSALSELSKSIHTPAGVTYGELKLNPAWDPLRKDPRFDNLLAQLAPRD